MIIIRVFPRRTSMTPTDSLAFVGDPPLWRPRADEVHVSVAFTWDLEEGRRLQAAWANHYDVVRIGGPAFGGAGEFVPGRYVMPGVTFTSRGCPRSCPWCLVPEREGELQLLAIKPGYIVNDNNLLACPRTHKQDVLAMLKAQGRAVSFSGGLEAARLDDWFAEELRGLRISQVFLSADTVDVLPAVERAIDRLSFLHKQQIRVYALIAYQGETMADAEARLEAVWQMGGTPFAQLYQPPGQYINYSREWRNFVRNWCRPALMFGAHGGWGN